jgi:hypothetical protein
LRWFSNDHDGVVLDDDGSVPAFSMNADVDSYSQRNGLAAEVDERQGLRFFRQTIHPAVKPATGPFAPDPQP